VGLTSTGGRQHFAFQRRRHRGLELSTSSYGGAQNSLPRWRYRRPLIVKCGFEVSL